MIIDEECKFASKFFGNLNIHDNVCYWMGEALPKEIAWLIVAHHYFGIKISDYYSDLVYNRKKFIYIPTNTEIMKKNEIEKENFVFNVSNIKINQEWVKNKMDAFNYFWVENNDKFS